MRNLMAAAIAARKTETWTRTDVMVSACFQQSPGIYVPPIRDLFYIGRPGTKARWVRFARNSPGGLVEATLSRSPSADANTAVEVCGSSGQASAGIIASRPSQRLLF